MKPETVKTPDQCYVKPHTTISRAVEARDLKRVLADIQLMYELCFAPVGIYRTAYAIAHPQITDQDPLRFYVTKDQTVIINPVITRSTEVGQLRDEGCMTFHWEKSVKIIRSHKIEVEYQTIDEDGELTDVLRFKAKGIEAQVVQHEIDHLNGKYLYPLSAFTTKNPALCLKTK